MTTNGTPPKPYSPRDFTVELMSGCLAAMMEEVPAGGTFETTAEVIMAVAFRYGCVLGVEKPALAHQLAYDRAAAKFIDPDEDPEASFARDREWADQVESGWTGWPK